jgi:hypothetical protein
MIPEEGLTILVFFWQLMAAPRDQSHLGGLRSDRSPVSAACQFGLPPAVTIVILPGHETCLTLKAGGYH